MESVVSAVSTRDLTKRYDKLVALSGLDLDIAPGEVFGLIGPNGAGKTTLLRILATLCEPTKGEARIFGIDVRESLQKIHRLTGFMPDFYALYDDLKVWEYLSYFAGLYEIPREDRKRLCDEMLARVNLSVKRDALVGEISRGMKQRLCLARALIHEPQLLLLDEPASGLDPQARLELKDLIKELQAQGKTLIISSHILTELSGFCTSFGLIEKGVLVKSGRLEDIEKEQTARTVFLEVLEDSDQVRNAIEQFPQVRIGAHDGRNYVLSLQGERELLVQFHRHLVQADVPVISLYEKRLDMEDVFQKYSRKEVS